MYIMKTIDEIMFMVDGINPFKEHLLIGRGGLGYKPYLPINGGTVNEVEPHKVKEYMESNDIGKMEKVLRAYERGRDNILSEDYDEKERKTDLPYINKVIDSIKRKIDRLDENEEDSVDELINSDDFKEQMEYYKNNIDNLDEDELESYIQSLGLIHEHKEEEKEIKATETEKEMTNAIKHLELLKGRELPNYHFKDEEGLHNELTPSEISEMINKIDINEGHGKKFEKVIEKIQDRVKKALTKDKSMIKNNDNIQRYKKTKTYMPKRDINGNIIYKSNGKVDWEEKPLSDFLVYDLSQDKNDIELKYYNVGTYKPNEKEIKNNGLMLQESKFVNSNFIPLYTSVNGETKLYNIWSVKTKDWVNDKNIKDVHVLYQTPSGNYSYTINKDKDLHKNDFTSFTGKNGEKLFILEPKYKMGKDNHGKDIFYIPYKKLKKIYL